MPFSTDCMLISSQSPHLVCLLAPCPQKTHVCTALLWATAWPSAELWGSSSISTRDPTGTGGCAGVNSSICWREKLGWYSVTESSCVMVSSGWLQGFGALSNALIQLTAVYGFTELLPLGAQLSTDSLLPFHRPFFSTLVLWQRSLGYEAVTSSSTQIAWEHNS